MQRFSALFAVALVASWLGGTRADEKSEGAVDKDFLIKVASCNHCEIEVSKLADRRAGSEKVKDFATMMVKDHRANYEKVAQLIKTRKVGVVAGLERETKDLISKLSKLEGAEFDQEYMQTMVKNHKKAITLFEGQVKNGSDEDITAFAKESLPVLQKHLRQAQVVAKAVEK